MLKVGDIVQTKYDKPKLNYIIYKIENSDSYVYTTVLLIKFNSVGDIKYIDFTKVNQYRDYIDRYEINDRLKKQFRLEKIKRLLNVQNK